MAQASSKQRHLRVLIIEDEESQAETLKRTICEIVTGASVTWEPDFGHAVDGLRDGRPDVVVLDLTDSDPTSGRVAGRPVWDDVWEHHFVPVVIYTAFPDVAVELNVPSNHPYVSVVQKGGKDSDVTVAQQIGRFVPSIGAIADVWEELHAVVGATLKAVTSVTAFTNQEGSPIPELLVRASRRRVAAAMDLETMASGEPLLAWEQYIVPPLGRDLLLGDVLRERESSCDDPAAHRIVLTPSCDLVRRDEGRAKDGKVLVARCIPVQDWFQRISLTTKRDAREKLAKALTEPLQARCLCLPSLPGVLPHLAADLRALELIQYAGIGDEAPDCTAEYVRVASVDSPFREHVGWAYQQVAGRVCLPDRDHASWADEALEAAKWSGKDA